MGETDNTFQKRFLAGWGQPETAFWLDGAANNRFRKTVFGWRGGQQPFHKRFFVGGAAESKHQKRLFVGGNGHKSFLKTVFGR
jgi:hypothetical protein